MRFSVVATVSAFAGTVVSAPSTQNGKRSLITEVGGLIGDLEETLGVNDLIAEADALLGGRLTKLNVALGVTFAEYQLGLVDEPAEPGVIQSVGETLALYLNGLGYEEANEFLDAATHGLYSDLNTALGVTDIDEALGLL